MRISIAHNRYRIRGGEDVVFERESALLEDAGFAISRYVRDSATLNGVSAKISSAIKLSYSRDEESSIRAFLRDHRPEVVHVHNYFPIITPAIFAACRSEGIPVVHTLHNFRLFCSNGLMLRDGKACSLCLDRRSTWPAVEHGCYRGSSLQTIPVSRMIRQNWLKGFLAENVDLFLCTTNFAKEIFLKAGLPASKIEVKPNFSPDLTQAYRREDLGYAIYLGRFSEEKGIRTLLAASNKLSLPLVFVGDGPLAGEIERAGHTIYRGTSQQEAHRLLAGSRLIIMPSECFESGIPLVLLEAMALKVPIVTSRFGAADEVFSDGENAWLFFPGDVEGLNAAVHSCLRSDASRVNAANNARKIYEQRFSPAVCLTRLRDIYGVLAQGKRR